MAAHQKKLSQLDATLGFTDECGLQLLPLVRSSLARRGQTPRLSHAAQAQDKVSVAAALTLSPVRGHISLYYQDYPDLYVDAPLYSRFLRTLLQVVRGPLVLLQDRGNMHQGPWIQAVVQDHPRLRIEPLPPYAPELNPVEWLWQWAKDQQLANFVPANLTELDVAVCHELDQVRKDQHRLKSFFAAAELDWSNTTLFF